MKNDVMSIEARIVTQLEDQLVCVERAILQTLHEPANDQPRQEASKKEFSNEC